MLCSTVNRDVTFPNVHTVYADSRFLQRRSYEFVLGRCNFLYIHISVNEMCYTIFNLSTIIN